jgi:hypothetical protein
MLAYILDCMSVAGVASADMDEVMKIDGMAQLFNN